MGDNVLEETVYRVISLTGHDVTPDDFYACHRLKNKDRVILKFKARKLKRSIQISRTILQQKSLELCQLKFSGKLFISESKCYENQQLAYKCRQLKSSKKIHLTWFWNSAVNIKVTPNGEIHQIFHTTDIEKLLGIQTLEGFINNTSFQSKYIRIFPIEFCFCCLYIFLSMLVFDIQNSITI